MEALKKLTEELDQKFENDFNEYLRKTTEPPKTRAQVRKILGDRRFEMSGFEARTGECTLHNQEVLNVFAKYGLYDYTEYLFLDFYKGHPTLYLRYWRSEEHLVLDHMEGWTTSQIILEILKLTVYSGKEKRSRL